MATRGRKPLILRNEEKYTKLVYRNYSIKEGYARVLTVISALTSKELSTLMNEAIGDLIHKYQSGVEINLFELRMIHDDEKECLSKEYLDCMGKMF